MGDGCSLKPGGIFTSRLRLFIVVLVLAMSPSVIGGGTFMGDIGAIGGSAIQAGASIYENQQQMNFNAQQAALNRQFQQQQTSQVENWETQMSDTQMQRRVADLKDAGLNPLLAISQGGASQPSVGAPGGATASVGPLQNPAQGLGQLTATIAQIDQANAQTEALKAQAKKTISETPTDKPSGIDPQTGEITSVADRNHQIGDANLAKIQADTGVSTAQAQQIKANTDLIGAQVQQVGSDIALKTAQALLTGANTDVIRGTLQSVISTAANEAKMGRARADVLGDPKWGPLIIGIQSLLPAVTSAVGAVKGTGILPTVGLGGRIP